MCFECIDADKKVGIQECDGRHTPFLTLSQVKADVKFSYFKQDKQKKHFRLKKAGIIDPPAGDYILGITHSLDGSCLPAKETIRLSFV